MALSGHRWRGRLMLRTELVLIAVRFRGRRCGRTGLCRDQFRPLRPQVQAAQPACLAWFGNKEDGKCLCYSNGQPVWVGTPQFNGGNGPDAGRSTGPLLPGTTINQGIG